MTTAPRPTGLAVIAIYVDELEPALAFYRDLLGFVITGEMPPGRMLELGDLKIYLEPGRRARSLDEAATMTGAEVAMVLLSDEVLALREHLGAGGAHLVGEAMGDGETFAMFRVADPAGNLLEVAGKP